MLKLKNIVKTYEMGDYTVHALRGVSLEFRSSEFVAILGASGCGKTTMLNIIGGLDRYTSGDLIIGNTSTKNFSSENWDAYRNATIGFVFQSYNLIPHLTILENVELALSLAGMDKKARRQKAAEALEKVGMGKELKKKPSQLSGGQMQRVAIARALVADPSIVLADEPTGALDSELSVQIMDLLAEVAKDRLVIMVTHNNELADQYATRTVRLKDGEVEYDTNPYVTEETEYEEEIIEATNDDSEEAPAPKHPKAAAITNAVNKKIGVLKEDASAVLHKLGIKRKDKTSPFKGTSMKMTTAFGLSFKNLVTKKRRTAMTAFAGSIGIISLGLVLAMSNGFNVFIDDMQTSTLASVPIGVYEYSMDYSVMTDMFASAEANAANKPSFPEGDDFYFDNATNTSFTESMIDAIMGSVGRNSITEEFVEYLDELDPSLYRAKDEFYGVQMHILAKTIDKDGIEYIEDVSPMTKETTALNIATQVLGENGQQPTNWYQLAGGKEFITKYYDVIAGTYPKNFNEIVMVVDGNNNIKVEALKQFGIDVYERDANNKIQYDENGDPIYKASMKFSDILGKEFTLVHNNEYYPYDASTDRYSTRPSKAEREEIYKNDKNVKLKVVGVLRTKPNASVSVVGTSLCYTAELGKYCVDSASKSNIAIKQKELLANEATKKLSVFGGDLPKDSGTGGDMLGFFMSGLLKTQHMKAIGVDTTPVYINIYPTDFNTKLVITEHIDNWNDNGGKVEYFDVSEMFIHNMRTILNLMTYVLIAVASISLIVSCVMISIITSNSVVERTREIGILRSLGARRRDISRVFNAETSILGLFSGALGIGITYALLPLVNLLIGNASGIYGLLNFSPLHAGLLIVLSFLLTFISGLIPSTMAANKNVVDALRIE